MHKAGNGIMRSQNASIKALSFCDAGLPHGASSSFGQQGVLSGIFACNKGANIFYALHWRSNKQKRGAASAGSAEAMAIHSWHYDAHDISMSIMRIDGMKAPVALIADAMSLCAAMRASNKHLDKSARRDVGDLRRLRETRAIKSARWIKGAASPADALTKKGCAGAQEILKRILPEGSISEDLITRKSDRKK
eukprot:Plantae.Rhodophyta-Hildenbrandia_rubra.ctg14367.p1 GENE.Plantae.Rhodophyta-Hildenbrandia_rubra.ctg14367~~Plantae.Rhodophyta-Hildenbrandia_rubra.ctg14367.p1  ORF type:complete len:193 (-),score=28.50 Plantae.Rhodophyta-Hildenbrandia_rubra.ctg14367:499-1077(-)